ncbi:hypothetical protein D9M73_206510 [compost metagenome]
MRGLRAESGRNVVAVVSNQRIILCHGSRRGNPEQVSAAGGYSSRPRAVRMMLRLSDRRAVKHMAASRTRNPVGGAR